MKQSKTLSAGKGSLGEKLKGYSLLAGSMFASSIAAGQVIYTDVNPDVELGGIVPDSFPYDSVYALDLNNDGIVDFNISVSISGTFSAGYAFSELIQFDNNPSNLVIPYTVGYLPVLLKLPCEDSIPFPYYQYGFNIGFFAFQNSNSVASFWNNEHDKHIGLKFKTAGAFHWGWARLDVNTTGAIPNIIIKDYAYESTANTKIEVCDTGFAVGIPLFEKKNSLTLFPNPSKGTGTIKLDQPVTGDLELAVRDALGKEVYKSTVRLNAQQAELPFDFSNLPAGIYLIQLKSETISLSQKWIKN